MDFSKSPDSSATSLVYSIPEGHGVGVVPNVGVTVNAFFFEKNPYQLVHPWQMYLAV